MYVHTYIGSCHKSDACMGLPWETSSTSSSTVLLHFLIMRVPHLREPSCLGWSEVWSSHCVSRLRLVKSEGSCSFVSF